jgi:hypothetical protein
MTATAPPLGPELLAGLRRLKLATIRAQAPEVLQTARTQRWAPEEVLRTRTFWLTWRAGACERSCPSCAAR